MLKHINSENEVRRMKELRCIIGAACGKKKCCYCCDEREECPKMCLNSPDKCRLAKPVENNKKEGAGNAE